MFVWRLISAREPRKKILLAKSLRIFVRAGEEWCGAGTLAVALAVRQQYQEGEKIMIKREDYQLPPKEGFVLTHFLTVADVKRSAEFYQRILGGTIVRSGEPTIIQIANSWLIVNVGGGPTDDKPNVTLRPPQNPNEVSSFLNIRVADIRASYEEWRRRGAEFLTEPKDHGREIRCYMRDPDGYIIEVGQTTGRQG
jgi:predicted enzyme related to lactoylglutathione lyase